MASYALPGPPPASIIDIAIAELAIYIVLVGPAVYITWKHGKAGMTCWSIFICVFGMRFASDIFQIIQRHQPQITGACLIVTEAGTLACLSLTIIGLVFEANTILPCSKREGWIQKILLAATHLTNTTGIAMATYSGAPSTTGGVLNPTLNKVGNIIMVAVMVAVCVWIWPSWKRTNTFSSHHNFRNSRWLLVAAFASMPFQLIRLVYNTTYAFNRVSSLDPVSGSFATQFVLLFLMHLAVVVVCMVGGWKSRRVADDKLTDENLNLENLNSA